LVSNKVVETIGGISVDEAISYPFTGAYTAVVLGNEFEQRSLKNKPFIDVGDRFKSSFNAVFFDLTRLKSSNKVLSGETQDVESILACKSDKLARFGPVNL